MKVRQWPQTRFSTEKIRSLQHFAICFIQPARTVDLSAARGYA